MSGHCSGGSDTIAAADPAVPAATAVAVSAPATVAAAPAKRQRRRLLLMLLGLLLKAPLLRLV